MSAYKERRDPRARRDLLTEILSFGPDVSGAPMDFSLRLRQLIRRVNEISRRIDKLMTRFD
jgi:hypothetical protein